MIAMQFDMQVPEIVSQSLGKRAMDRAFRAAYEATGNVHHQKLIPRHFEKKRQDAYRDKPRSKGYAIAKAKIAGKGKAAEPDTDRVFSGLMKQSMCEFATVRSYPTRYTITMQAPRYMTMRPYKINQPDKFKEIEAMAADDWPVMEGVFQKELERTIEDEEFKLLTRESKNHRMSGL